VRHVDLSQYSRGSYDPGHLSKRVGWYVVNALFVDTKIPWPQKLKKWLLIFFGARIGTDFVIKPRVSVKYPWFLEAGEHVWIGEGVWIDNLSPIKIGNHVCISQGTAIFTGNHDYKKTSFDLIVKPVEIHDGVWVGAKCVICPGVILGTHSVITAGSVVTNDTETYFVYQGNPARSVRGRELK